MRVGAHATRRSAWIRLSAIAATAAITTATVVATSAVSGAAPRAVKSAATPRPGGTVTYGLESETGGGWCPTSERLAASGIMVESAIYDTLVQPNTKNVMVPYLAKSVDHNPDYTQWTIKLRDGIKFHDGTPLDANALKTNVEAWRTGQLYSSIYSDITDVAVVDPLTVSSRISTSTAGKESSRRRSSPTPTRARAT
jgi:peptide/nickel transport system substrate-binding protein